mgnify:FL=1
MKFSKVTKIITALVMIATVALACNMVFASASVNIDVPEQASVEFGGFGKTVNNILGVVTYVCYAAAVVMLLYLGVKYITASPEGKAEIKKSAIIYVIGAVLVFAAGIVIRMIKDLAPKIVKES